VLGLGGELADPGHGGVLRVAGPPGAVLPSPSAQGSAVQKKEEINNVGNAEVDA
jgi:hypothetical protein